MSIDRIAIVTGASSELGRAVALDLSAAGFVVIAAGPREHPLMDVPAHEYSAKQWDVRDVSLHARWLGTADLDARD